jgi:photosystem II stability/assembly factor-like uncharacterized protein
MPLVAAGAVAAVAAAVVGISAGGRHTASAPPATQLHSAPRPVPTPSPSSVPTPASSAVPTTAATATLDLANFRAIDLTFAGSGLGWGLGSADCVNDPGRPCAAMIYTTDGGRSWHSMKQPPGASIPLLSCSGHCIRQVRFANEKIGYAFGPSTLYMTTDGGRSWQLLDGGAVALETLDGNVIRVSTKCVPGCPYLVQTAPLGAAGWHTTKTIDGGMSPGVSLVRTGSAAYLAVFGHTAGGAERATTALWASTDDGRTWADRGEPCPQHTSYGEVDSTRLAAAADGSVTVLCTPRQAGAGWQFTVTSTDAGRSFHAGDLTALGASPADALAAGSAKVLLVGLADGVYRSTDGGATFARVGANAGSGPSGQDLTFAGFESGQDARVADDGGRTIWTTHDAGATWTALRFP